MPDLIHARSPDAHQTEHAPPSTKVATSVGEDVPQAPVSSRQAHAEPARPNPYPHRLSVDVDHDTYRALRLVAAEEGCRSSTSSVSPSPTNLLHACKGACMKVREVLRVLAEDGWYQVSQRVVIVSTGTRPSPAKSR